MNSLFFKNSELIVAVGSTNPVKVGAVETVLNQAVAKEALAGVRMVRVISLAAKSGVPDQPIGDEQTSQGALSRARAVLEQEPQAELGVGIEGGVIQLGNDFYTNAWCAIVARQGATSLGGGLIMPLPPAIVRDLQAGYELGDATDRLFGVKHSKQAGGAVGYLSKDLQNRKQAYESVFTYALVKFINPTLYEII